MTNASIYGQLIFDKSAKIIHVGKMVWLTNDADNWIIIPERIKVDSYFT